MNYFTDDEIRCQHCGDLVKDQEFIDWLNGVRWEFGKPMIITSWYRCPDHPIEKHKLKPGTHSTSRAVDVKVADGDAIKLIEIASRRGCVRIGVNQNVFVHLDRCDDYLGPQLWTY